MLKQTFEFFSLFEKWQLFYSKFDLILWKRINWRIDWLIYKNVLIQICLKNEISQNLILLNSALKNSEIQNPCVIWLSMKEREIFLLKIIIMKIIRTNII